MSFLGLHSKKLSEILFDRRQLLDRAKFLKLFSGIFINVVYFSVNILKIFVKISSI